MALDEFSIKFRFHLWQYIIKWCNFLLPFFVCDIQLMFNKLDVQHILSCFDILVLLANFVLSFATMIGDLHARQPL